MTTTKRVNDAGQRLVKATAAFLDGLEAAIGRTAQKPFDAAANTYNLAREAFHDAVAEQFEAELAAASDLELEELEDVVEGDDPFDDLAPPDVDACVDAVRAAIDELKDSLKRFRTELAQAVDDA